MRKNLFYVLIFISLGFILGWFFNAQLNKIDAPPKALREGGYSYINPLLLCDVGTNKQFGEEVDLYKKIQEKVDEAKNSKRIDKASVYFRDLNTGKWASFNEDDTYIPASLGKVPILIAYLKLAESNPGILNKKFIYDGYRDDNKQQEIAPDFSLTAGKSYSVSDLLFLMVAYSDNNSATLLYKNLNHDSLKDIYTSLGLPFKNGIDGPQETDLLTARQYSYFFRVLFNSTYLSRENSEASLKALTQVSFKDGIVAGIPKGIEVSHKFGLASILDSSNKKIISRELHDCGIIYTKNPYLLCVMTKSSSPISEIEDFISGISQLVYANVKN